MSNGSSSSSSGVVSTGILQIVFIVLKLLGKIDWTWGWVLAPTWISAIILVVIFGILGIVYLVNR